MKKYTYIEIMDRSYGTTERKPARKVSKRLAVARSHTKYDNTYKIFSIVAQRAILDVRFISPDDAFVSAQLIEEAYDYEKEPEISYLDIWESDPDIAALAVSRLTIPNGEAIYANLKQLEKRKPNVVTLEDIKKALNVNSQ